MDISIFSKEQKEIENTFFIYKDELMQEWHFCETLANLKEKLKAYYLVNKPFKNDGAEYTVDELDQSIAEIMEDHMQKIDITLRKPNFKINSAILRESINGNLEEIERINPLVYNTSRVKNLLVKWSLTQDEKPLPFSLDALGELPAAVFDGIVMCINKSIPYYFGLSVR